MNPKTKRILVETISLLFILLFVYAAANKLVDYRTFKFQLGRSPYVTGVAGLVAWVLPSGELLIATALIFKKTMFLGLYASFFLMLLFTGYIYAMLHYSYFIPCSCGGILSKMGWSLHFYFNMVFTFLALAGTLLYQKIKPATA